MSNAPERIFAGPVNPSRWEEGDWGVTDEELAWPEHATCYVRDDGWQPIESAPKDGTLILGCWMLKAPWNPPLFSERYGYWKHRRLLGFRWGWRDREPLRPALSPQQED